MKRKKSKPDRQISPPPSRPPADSKAVFAAGSRPPSGRLRTALSVGVTLHLLALFASFTHIVAPSSVHSRVNRLVQPYLRPAHFSADERPVYLSSGDPSEQPHQLQVSTSAIWDLDSVDDATWRKVGPEGRSGLAVSDRRARWLAAAAMLAEREEPGMVADLLLPIAQREQNVAAIRIIRLPTDLNDINSEVETPYVARVIRRAEQVSLVQLLPERLSAPVVQPGNPQFDE